MVTQKEARGYPLSPAFGVPHLTQTRKMTLPINSTVTAGPAQFTTGVALGQAFNSLAGNAIGLAYPNLINPLLLNGPAGSAGNFGIGQPSGSVANRNVYLPFPAVVSIQGPNLGATFNISVRMTGVTHLGVYKTVVDTGISTAAGFFEGGACWQFLESIEILSYGGAGTAVTDLLSAGWTFTHSGLSATRLPLPFDAAQQSEIVGVALVTPGAAGVFAAWTIGQLVLPNTAASAMGTVNFQNGTARFNLGNNTTPATTPMEYIVVPSSRAINAH